MHTALLVMVLAGAPVDGAKLARLLGFTGAKQEAQVTGRRTTPLRCRLLGTLLGPTPLAALEWDARVVTVTVGDVLADVEVVEIERRKVRVRRNGELEDIVESLVFEPRPNMSVGQPAKSISTQKMAELLQRPESVIGDARMFPIFENGSMHGFRCDWVKPGSFAASLGLQKGDVLTRVNGIALSDVTTLMKQLPKLAMAQRFEVELERNGQRSTEFIDVRP